MLSTQKGDRLSNQAAKEAIQAPVTAIETKRGDQNLRNRSFDRVQQQMKY